MAKIPPHKLPYRPCVGIMLINRDGRVWIGRRSDEPNDEGAGQWWQMPQGGIDPGEHPLKAAARELFEETGVHSAEFLAEAPQWYYYDLPPHLLGVSWGGRYRGQKQRWFAFRFLGDDREINIAPQDHKPEFDQWRWVKIDEVTSLIVPFKRQVYEQVVDALRPLVS
jgi:putative (di)nucleoside polyphosphate hydrolase